jgi:hypothetical protein
VKIFYGLTNTSDEFRKLAELCVKHNGTHVFVSDLARARWWWDRDRSDPYSGWGMLAPTILRTIPPEPLKPFLPRDWVEYNLDLLAMRAEILREYGLKGAFHGCEPGWLPDEVFVAYPEWRGPRCEKPRRARNACYSLCIDNEEVLGMYADSLKTLCEMASIEYFSFLTNDSGAGICWSKGLYAGPNGNTHCEHIGFGKRVSKFLTTLQNAAKAAGHDAIVEIAGSIPDYEIEELIPYLKAGQAVNGRNNANEPLTFTIGYRDGFYSNGVYPAYNIPQPMNFIRQHAEARAHGERNMIVCVESLEEGFTHRLYDKCEKSPTPVSLKDCENLLYDFASDETDALNADDLYELWGHVNAAKEAVLPVTRGGPIFLLGTVNQRWLTRPFVADPLELEPEEKNYYRDYQFQAGSEEDAADLMILQGIKFVGGHSAAYIVSNILDFGISELEMAAAKGDRIAAEAKSEDKKSEFDILSTRLRAFICIFRNARNAVKFQEIIDKTDKNERPVELPHKYVKGDQRLHELNNIVRAEIDNTADLIRIIQTSPAPVIMTAKTVDEEDIMQLSPNLVDQLQKKIDIMLKHQMDFDKYYVRNT